jgi:serine/threonine-protein kinase haspin
LETTIIDYSLSRADIRMWDGPSEKVETAASDLDRKQLFNAVGHDEDERRLRDTYRL